MIQEMRDEMYAILDRMSVRAESMDRPLDFHDIKRLEALLGQVEVFTKQHHSNCE